jgi:hypothetical protein
MNGFANIYEQCRQLKNYLYSVYDPINEVDNSAIYRLFSPRRQIIYSQYINGIHEELKTTTKFRFYEAQILSSDLFSKVMKQHWLQMKTEFPKQYAIVINHMCKYKYDPYKDELR